MLDSLDWDRFHWQHILNLKHAHQVHQWLHDKFEIVKQSVDYNIAMLSSQVIDQAQTCFCRGLFVAVVGPININGRFVAGSSLGYSYVIDATTFSRFLPSGGSSHADTF